MLKRVLLETLSVACIAVHDGIGNPDSRNGDTRLHRLFELSFIGKVQSYIPGIELPLLSCFDGLLIVRVDFLFVVRDGKAEARWSAKRSGPARCTGILYLHLTTW